MLQKPATSKAINHVLTVMFSCHYYSYIVLHCSSYLSFLKAIKKTETADSKNMLYACLFNHHLLMFLLFVFKKKGEREIHFSANILG